MKSLLNHSTNIQEILFLKSKKIGVEMCHTQIIGLSERVSIKLSFPESLCSITAEPILAYCKKNKVEYKIRPALSEGKPVTEIEISI